MSQISLTFPDGNTRDYAAGVTPAEVAARIAPSLAKAAISARWTASIGICNGRSQRMRPIAINTMKDDAPALELIRHDLAHIMARAVQEIWPDVKVTIGPVRDYGWFYDFDRDEPFTPEDLGAIEARMKQIINAREPVQDRGLGPRRRDRLLRGRERALQGGTDRPHPRRRGPAHVLARRLAGSVPRPASAAHRPGAGRCLQADACRRRLLAGRCHRARCCSASTAWPSATATI